MYGERRIMRSAIVMVALLGFAGCSNLGNVAPAIANVALATAATVAGAAAERRTDERRLEEMQWPHPRRALEDAARPLAPVVRLRVHMSEDYRVQTLDAERGFRAAIERANEIVDDNGLGVRFEIASFNRWPRSTGAAPISALLDDLEREDAGATGELIVGLITRLAVTTNPAMDDIGDARILGGHVLIRALAADAGNDVEEAAPHASPAALAAASRAERLHLVAIVFLHEWAHTLGAIHSLEQRSIMAPMYSRLSDRFGDTSREILQTMIPAGRPDDTVGRTKRLLRVRELVEAAPLEMTQAAEREQVLAMLPVPSATPAASGAHSTPDFTAAVGEFPSLVLITDRLSLEPEIMAVIRARAR